MYPRYAHREARAHELPKRNYGQNLSACFPFLTLGWHGASYGRPRRREPTYVAFETLSGLTIADLTDGRYLVAG